MHKYIVRETFPLRFARAFSVFAGAVGSLLVVPVNPQASIPRNRAHFSIPQTVCRCVVRASLAWLTQNFRLLKQMSKLHRSDKKARRRPLSILTPRPGAPPAKPEPRISHPTSHYIHMYMYRQTRVPATASQPRVPTQTRTPSLLHPEPLFVSAPRPKPAPGNVLDPRAEDEVAPPPLPASPVARGQGVVEHARHAGPDVGFPRCL